jgi:hypothetical protein
MSHLFARKVVLEFAVVHAGEIVPAAVVVGGVLDAEIPVLVAVVTALRRTVESGALAPYMIARALMRFASRGLRVGLDADVDVFGPVFERR